MGRILLITCALSAFCHVQVAYSQNARGTQPSIERPLDRLPYTPSLDISAMDRSANPCADFYQYACGGWVSHNQFPPIRRVGVSTASFIRQPAVALGILENLAHTTATRSANQQKIGDYFAACMDETTIDRLGAAPIAPTLARIESLQSVSELPALLAQLHRTEPQSSGFLFTFGSNQDYADSSQVIAFAMAAGSACRTVITTLIKMPGARAAAVSIRNTWLEHSFCWVRRRRLRRPMQRRCSAWRPPSPDVRLRASSSGPPQTLPQDGSSKRSSAGTPHFDWAAYLAALNLEGIDTFNVSNLSSTPLPTVVCRHPARRPQNIPSVDVAKCGGALSVTEFESEHFEFFSAYLCAACLSRSHGGGECVAQVDALLGEALGQEFVARTFGPQLKASTQKMTRQSEQAMREISRQSTG